MVLFDPPSIADSEVEGVFSVRQKKNYSRLLAWLSTFVSPGGYLVAFANTRSMTDRAFLVAVRDGLSLSRLDFKEVDELSQDVDFRYKENDRIGKYLKGLVLRRAGGTSMAQ